MSRTTRVVIGALCVIAGTMGDRIAVAQPKAAPTNIAVVDTVFLMRNAAAAKSAHDQIEQIRTGFQREIKAKQDEIAKSSQALVRDRATVSQDVYEQRVADLRKKIADMQHDAQAREDKLDRALADATLKITAVMVQAVDDIKKERKFVLVFTRSTVVGTVGVPDITQDVLKRVNQRMPTISVSLPH